MRASDIHPGSEYEAQLGRYGWSKARVVVLSQYSSGHWSCQVVEGSSSAVPKGTVRIIPSRNVVRPWSAAEEDYRNREALAKAWEKAEVEANRQTESLVELLAQHAEMDAGFIDIDTDSSGLPGEVTVTLDITLPQLRRLALALSPDSSVVETPASPLSELISL